MNSILQLKGQFEHQSGNSGGGKRNIPVGRFVESAHILSLINDLRSLQTYWSEHTLIKGALISVYYTSVVAKSNRIGAFCVVVLLIPTTPFEVLNLLEKHLISSMYSHTMLD